MNQESLPSLRKTYFRSLESLRKKVTSLKADVKESKEELTELKGERKKLEDELFLYRSQAAAQKMDRDTFAYLRADIKESIQRKKEDIISVQETIREKSIEIDQLEQKIEEENKRGTFPPFPFRHRRAFMTFNSTLLLLLFSSSACNHSLHLHPFFHLLRLLVLFYLPFFFPGPSLSSSTCKKIHCHTSACIFPRRLANLLRHVCTVL